jgi:hypothetical protein
MERVRTKLSVVQNLGLADRMVRVFIGTALLAGGVVSMFSNAVLTWEPYAMLISIYPLMTCLLGWDPLYATVDARTCSLEGGRNACGTFPYEVDAVVMGDKLVPHKDYDHSLYDAHHEPGHKGAA